MTITSISRGVAQPGSAPGLGPGGRRFESFLPDQFQEINVKDGLLGVMKKKSLKQKPQKQ